VVRGTEGFLGLAGGSRAPRLSPFVGRVAVGGTRGTQIIPTRRSLSTEQGLFGNRHMISAWRPRGLKSRYLDTSRC